MKPLVWPVATYGCESWTLGENEETHQDAFEMKGLRKILRVSRTAKKKMSWFLAKLAVMFNTQTSVTTGRIYAMHSVHYQYSSARKTTHGLDGQHQDVDRTLRGIVNQNDRDKWRKYVHGVANPRIEDD